ncbi:MAG: outer membrane protein assembly factor BamD [Pseudomonadota bacterium]|nr:outer membrane protein assembly factor BamD [Pseudomonadota bacterium]
MKTRPIRPLRLATAALLLGASLGLGACSGEEETPAVAAARQEIPVEVLYNQALDELQQEDYDNAAESFDLVERQYPYSVWATKAQLMAVFSYYMTNEYEQAIGAAERFIRLHPGSADAAYAYYMIAVCHYEQITDVGRDQGRTVNALNALEETIRRFPKSAYAQDAQAKMALVRDHLAGKEMEIGRYYQGGGHYVAAINRFQKVVAEYQTTSHVPEALHRLTEAYLSLGVTDEAQATAAVLGHNFPNTSWYRDSYALLSGRNLAPAQSSESWISQIWNSVF